MVEVGDETFSVSISDLLLLFLGISEPAPGGKYVCCFCTMMFVQGLYSYLSMSTAVTEMTTTINITSNVSKASSNQQKS